MTLYTHQESNIRKTWLLFSLFLVIVIAIGWVFSRIYGNPGIVLIAVIFSSLMSVISYWYSDKIVLAMANAKEVKRESARDLYNLVENLTIASGLPMPKLYIVEDMSPNAFATGRDAEHAVVAVTTGLLAKLEKPELEGVVAHELSHIGNKDMLLQTVVVVLVGFVALISDFFMRSMWWGRMDGDRGSNRGGHPYLILAGVALAILAPIATTLIQLAISRKREYLADASGALLTRYPEGLARALEKISSDPNPLKFANKATNHLWIAEPRRVFGKKAAGLFMTHPPVTERVKRLREMHI
jgi:heat shock protein HtpX